MLWYGSPIFLRQRSGQQCRLVEPSFHHATPVQGNGRNQRVGRQDIGHASRHPVGRGFRDILTVPMFERQHQFSPHVAVNQGGTTLHPGRRVDQACIAMRNFVRRTAGQRNTATVTHKTCDERSVAPACSAKAPVGCDRLRAPHAGRWIK